MALLTIAHQEFTHADFAVVRTPLLPFEEFLSISPTYGGGLVNPEHDRDCARERLMTKFRGSLVQEALLVASKSLHARCIKWLSSPGKADAKVERALLKYYARMSSRSTPFGLCAGISWGPIEDVDSYGETHRVSRIDLASRDAYRRDCRVDMQVIVELRERLLADAAVRRQLSYCANPTLYQRAGRWHFLESQTGSDGRRFGSSAVESSPYLDDLLQQLQADGSNLSWSEVARKPEIIVPGATYQETADFIDELIANGVLLSELDPCMTAGDPLPHFRRSMNETSDEPTKELLDTLERRIEQLNTTRPGEGADKIASVDAAVSLLLHGNATLPAA